MTGAAPPGDERYVPSGDAAETDAWRVIAERLRGGNAAGFTMTSPATVGRVMAWLAVIAADELTVRAREAGGAVTLAEGRQLALAKVEERLLACGAPDLAGLTASD